jgi:hypothetical protein
LPQHVFANIYGSLGKVLEGGREEETGTGRQRKRRKRKRKRK